MTLVLVAHGTRDPLGRQVSHDLAARVRSRLPGVDVRVAFADVCAPDLTTVLREVDGPAVVVPAFLAAGYHVRVDIPKQVAESGHPCVTVTEPFGPSPLLVEAVHARLVEAGWRGGRIVLAAAGSSDPHALADVRRAADLLAARTAESVEIGYVTTASPRVTEVAQGLAVASWLLAPGLFHRAVRDAGACLVGEPIGAHRHAVELVVRRYTGSVNLALSLATATHVPPRSFCRHDSAVG